MPKKKLNLKDLTVESFITSSKYQGGAPRTDDKDCTKSVGKLCTFSNGVPGCLTVTQDPLESNCSICLSRMLCETYYDRCTDGSKCCTIA